MTTHQDYQDYEPDVEKLNQVWKDIKKPHPKMMQTIESHQPKQKLAKTQQKESSSKPQKKSLQKKTQVIISQQNVQVPKRNPKANSQQVIEIVTRPDRFYETNLKNEKNNTGHQHLFLNNPDKIIVGEVEELRREIEKKNQELSLFRVSNGHHEDKIRRLQNLIEGKDQQIEELVNRERQLVNQMSSMNSKQLNFNYGKVEYENFRNDSRRLLKMLKNTQEYQTFADFALDDDGVRFLNHANKTVKTRLDVPNRQLHYCTCNKEFLPEPALWVPQKAYDFSKQFIKERKGDLSQAQLELLLYELNRIWREREKRIVNSVNALKANEIGKYKRKLQNAEVSRERIKAPRQ